ncbi:hypothetical protein DPMN_114566 [Dreissena polymorpha]|uniref:Uncharacterized protein n=1 Tax=Dreissena polymorpha TaxID=45954 RepID=A0A9D4QRV0_DREPO|nr:hypothetical protein DPMN_114566 [Dreissena polymorpha]
MEIRSRDSQKRERTGKMLHLWGQSLFILGRLIDEVVLGVGYVPHSEKKGLNGCV